MADSTHSLQELAQDFVHGREFPHVIRLRLGEVHIHTRTNSEELAERLHEYMGFFLDKQDGEPDILITAVQAESPELDLDLTIKQPGPGKTKIKEEFIDIHGGRIVRKRITGMVFGFGKGLNIAVGDCVTHRNQVTNFINNRFMQWTLNHGYILGHAAGVKLGDKGLAIAGFSGAGKSTLALHMMNLGTTFVSNDRLLVKKTADCLDMLGVAKLPRINPGTIVHNEKLWPILSEEERARFLAMPKEELWSLELKYDAFIDELYGADKFELSAPMQGLVILNWNHNEGPAQIREINPAQRSDLLPAFIKSPGLFYEPDGLEPEIAFSQDVYVDHLSACKVFEVTGGVDFDHTANTFLDFLHS